MFNGYDALQLKTDHLDISFGNPDVWPVITPMGSIKSFIFDMGDDRKGPTFQLGLMTTIEGEELDWPHSIDPPHFHGSDQFRVVVGGQWELAGKTQSSGGYSLQESGRIYREHPGASGKAWLLLVIGDRRGAKPHIIRSSDVDTLIDIDNDYFKPTENDEEYPHPAGPKGTTAIASTNGPCEQGYQRNNAADLSINTASTSLFGDHEAGPVAQVFNYGPNQQLMPASHYATERLLVITNGACIIDGKHYNTGDVRIQNAAQPMAAIISGPEGVQITMIVADRRACTTAKFDTEPPPPWLLDVPKVQQQLAKASV